jgi:hypothetical protein
MDTHDTDRKQGTIQSQRPICVVCVHVVSASILSLAFDLCRVCPCCLCRRQGTIQSQRQHGHTRHRSKARGNTEPETTWTHTTQVEGKGQYRARDNMDTHDTGRMLSLALYCPLPSTYVVCAHVVSGSVLSLAFDLCRVCPCCLWLCIVPCLRPVSCVSMLSLALQSQRQHGHTRHRSKARDNIEPETIWTHTTQVEPVSCVSMLSLALYCPFAFDLCRVCPCCL